MDKKYIDFISKYIHNIFMKVLRDLKKFILEKILRFAYNEYIMSNEANHINEIIDNFLGSEKFKTLSDAEKNKLREELEGQYLDLYHKTILKNLEPYLYNDFYQLSKAGDSNSIESFLFVNINNYEALTESIYLDFVSSLVDRHNQGGENGLDR